MDDSKWSVYEANVQAYRGNFLSSQSLMIAVGAIILNESYILTTIVAIIALIQIWYIWFRIIYCRCLIVDFYKFSMQEKFDEWGNVRTKKSNSYLTEQRYVKKRKVRKNVNENMKKFYDKKSKFTNMRITRIKLDVMLPITMSIIWMVFIFYSKMHA